MCMCARQYGKCVCIIGGRSCLLLDIIPALWKFFFFFLMISNYIKFCLIYLYRMHWSSITFFVLITEFRRAFCLLEWTLISRVHVCLGYKWLVESMNKFREMGSRNSYLESQNGTFFQRGLHPVSVCHCLCLFIHTTLACIEVESSTYSALNKKLLIFSLKLCRT